MDTEQQWSDFALTCSPSCFPTSRVVSAAFSAPCCTACFAFSAPLSACTQHHVSGQLAWYRAFMLLVLTTCHLTRIP
jgi:hypothetical protein